MKRNIYTLIFLLISCYSFSQIVHVGSTSASGSHVSSLTFSKTILGGINRILYVGVTTESKNVTSITWNGTSLTQHSLIRGSSHNYVGLFYLRLGTSATSITANVVVNVASSDDVCAGASDFTGVYQTTPFLPAVSSQSNSTTPSLTFTSTTGNLAVSIVGVENSTVTANGSGQTELWTSTGSINNRSSYKNSAASVTMSHTLSTSKQWLMIGGTMQDNETFFMPIELLYFTGNLENNKVIFKWETATEKNNDFFEIERSKDGFIFESISKTKSKAHEGNSISSLSYTFVDENPLDGESYYRLKQVDFSHDFSYSKIVSVTFNKQYNISFVTFPNPNDGVFSVKLTGIENYHDIDVSIYDKNGKLVYYKKTDSYAIKDNSFSIQLNDDVKSGIYTLVYSMEGLEYSAKMVVQ